MATRSGEVPNYMEKSVGLSLYIIIYCTYLIPLVYISSLVNQQLGNLSVTSPTGN